MPLVATISDDSSSDDDVIALGDTASHPAPAPATDEFNVTTPMIPYLNVQGEWDAPMYDDVVDPGRLGAQSPIPLDVDSVRASTTAQVVHMVTQQPRRPSRRGRRPRLVPVPVEPGPFAPIPQPLMTVVGTEVWVQGHTAPGSYDNPGDAYVDHPVVDNQTRDRPITSISCGRDHVLYVAAADGSVWAAGRNHHGQLGVSGIRDRGSFTRVPLPREIARARSVACIEHTTCIVPDERPGLYMCGLALCRSPRGDVAEIAHIPQPVPELADHHVVRVSIAASAIAVVTTAGELFVWGRDTARLHGCYDSRDRHRERPTLVEFFRTTGVSDACVAPGMVAAVSRADGRLYTWGSNERGRLGYSITSHGSLTPKPVISLPGPVRTVACGTHHVVAVLQSGEVYAWGCDGHGQLGLAREPTEMPGAYARLVPTRVPFFSEPWGRSGREIRSVVCRNSATAYVLISGETYMCGGSRIWIRGSNGGGSPLDISVQAPLFVTRMPTRVFDRNRVGAITFDERVVYAAVHGDPQLE